MRKGLVFAIVLTLTATMLVAGIPLPASADIHHVVKGAQGPRSSAVTWLHVPAENGFWLAHIVNSGLRSLVLDVVDVSSGASVLHQRIRFAEYPSDTVDSMRAVVAKDRPYQVTATPNGARGSYCDITDDLYRPYPPVAAFAMTKLSDFTIAVDGSASYDLDGTIVAWAWNWGDGSTATGVTATHSYQYAGTFTVTLTVMDNDGMTGSTSMAIGPPPPGPPTAAFTYSTSYYSITVNASGSTDDIGIVSYDWNWGDGATGSGMIATHTYLGPGTYAVTLVVTNVWAMTDSLSKVVTIITDAPPAAISPS